MRGKGLLAALVLDSSRRAGDVAEACPAAGLIVLPGGYEGDALALTPAFTADPRQVAWGLAVLDEALS